MSSTEAAKLADIDIQTNTSSDSTIKVEKMPDGKEYRIFRNKSAPFDVELPCTQEILCDWFNSIPKKFREYFGIKINICSSEIRIPTVTEFQERAAHLTKVEGRFEFNPMPPSGTGEWKLDASGFNKMVSEGYLPLGPEIDGYVHDLCVHLSGICVLPIVLQQRMQVRARYFGALYTSVKTLADKDPVNLALQQAVQSAEKLLIIHNENIDKATGQFSLCFKNSDSPDWDQKARSRLLMRIRIAAGIKQNKSDIIEMYTLSEMAAHTNLNDVCYEALVANPTTDLKDLLPSIKSKQHLESIQQALGQFNLPPLDKKLSTVFNEPEKEKMTPENFQKLFIQQENEKAQQPKDMMRLLSGIWENDKI